MARRTTTMLPNFRRTRAGDDRACADRRGWQRLSPVLVTAPLAALTAVFAWGGPPPAFGLGLPTATAADRDRARFTICDIGARTDCVIDGDTFWYRGEKVGLADVNTPEISQPQCMAEARLGQEATARLHTLLNAGAFTLAAGGRERDRYGRLLRVVTRGGESVGLVLVREGLAEERGGARGSWC